MDIGIDPHGDYPVDDLPTPSPSLSAATVVDAQLDALRTNDDPRPDAGVATAYNFASPANRRATGPLPRFVEMVRGRLYAPMIDHVEATAGPVERTADGGARRRVTLTGPDGRTVTYAFGLSRTTDGPLDGCWLTDSVMID
jgi:hypothetical protein